MNQRPLVLLYPPPPSPWLSSSISPASAGALPPSRTASVLSRSTLNMPDAKGLLWVASDGNEFLKPNVVWYLLHRILQKKKQNGDPAYSSIHGLAYFSPRMLGQIPGVSQPALLWFSGYGQPDPQLKACLDELSDEWPKYVSWAQGIYIHSAVGKVEDVRFHGVEEKMMEISLDNQDK